MRRLAFAASIAGVVALALLVQTAVVPLAQDEPARANPQASPDDDPSWGPVDAPVTIIEFSDYQCPYCKRFHDETLPQIQAIYEGQVRFVYRDFPLTSIHPHAQKAAEASECADDQGRFWDYHDLLWTNQQDLDVASLKAYAGELGLDTATFDDCLESGKNAQEVQKDYSDGVSYGVQGTPSFFINDVKVQGAQPFSVIRSFCRPRQAPRQPPARNLRRNQEDSSTTAPRQAAGPWPSGAAWGTRRRGRPSQPAAKPK